jgi:uncharacterized membrane protein YgcG
LTCLLEPALGPVWVFIALGEAPALASIVSGVCLVVALAAHEIIPLCLATKTTTSATIAITSHASLSPHEGGADGGGGDGGGASGREESDKLIVVSAKSG